MTLKQKMISRINKQFGLHIPIDYPIKTHQGRKFKDSGSFNWYLCGDNLEYNRFGACEPLYKMLQWKGDYVVFEENMYKELIPEIGS